MHCSADEFHRFRGGSDIPRGEDDLLTVFVVCLGEPFVQDFPSLGSQSRRCQRLKAVALLRRASGAGENQYDSWTCSSE